MKTYKWKTLGNLKSQISKLKTEEILETLLDNRGVRTEKEREEFLNPKLENLTIDSVGIDNKEVDKTLKRIKKAIENNEKIIIYGDYDVDGVCGTAILWETIYSFYKNIEPYIPHRVEEGYGLSKKGISNLIAQNSNVKLIITVDNGIVANDAVDFANENGIDVIVTDHHVRSDNDPNTLAIVHTTKLCGTGVAYLLSKEISNFEFSISNPPLSPRERENDREGDNHLELVALATVADLVPLIGANRTLLRFGLEKLRETNRPGLLALFAEAQIKKDEINTYHIGHIIAPRINASGRITHALDSLRLICTTNPSRAKELAQNLGEVNRNRQTFTLESTLHADTVVDVSQKFIFVSHEDYEEGVIGLIASRLVEKHYKPAIAISIGEQFSKGSARSVSGFNIIEFLRTFSTHYVNAGGHPMAAGFTIETVKLEEFKNALLLKATELITEELLERVLNIDLEIDFSVINLDLYNQIQILSPFGMANSEPLFVSKKIKIEKAKTVGKDQRHLKLSVSQNEKEFDAIFFNGMESGVKVGDSVDVVFSIDKNSWNGNEKIQLKIKDLRRLTS